MTVPDLPATETPATDEKNEGTATRARRGRGPGLRRMLRSPEFGVGAALGALLVVFFVLEPVKFGTIANFTNLAADSSTLMILAVVTTFMLVSRNLDLSVGGIITFAEVSAAQSMSSSGGIRDALVGLAVAVVGGALWGVVNGELVTRLRIPPFVATLATLGMAHGAALVLSKGVDISTVPQELVLDVGVNEILGLPTLVWIAALVVGAGAWALGRSPFGRHVRAIGSDPIAAARAGIDVGGHTRRVFLIAGAAYGLVAWLNLARFSSTTVGGHYNDALDAITSVALGGTSLFGGVGSILGSAIGVFIPGVLRNGLIILHVQPFWQEIAIGLALAFAVGIDRRRRR